MVEKQTISISTGSIVKTILILILFAIVFFLKDLVLVVFTAVILASAIEPATTWFENHRVPRLLGVVLTYLVIAAVIAGIFYFILPQLLQEILAIFDSVDKYLKATNQDSRFISLRPLFQGLSGAISIKEAISNLAGSISSISGGFIQTAGNIFGGVVSFVVIIVLSFYLAVQRDGVGNFLKIITPERHEKYVLGLWKRSQLKIGQWMQGQLLLSLIVGILTYLGLLLLGVHDALILAIFTALCEFIPLFGPIVGAVPAVIFAYINNNGLTMALLTAGMYLIIHQLENQLIYPLVVRKIVGINPVIVIVSLLAGYELAGFLGILIAVPLATIGMEYLRDIEQGKTTAQG